MAGVLCCGIAVQDFVFAVDSIPTTAEKHRARDLAVVGGGIAASAAVAVARLGGRAWLATRLGDDLVGDAIVADLAREGVDVALARRFPGCRSPLSAVMVDAAGERLILSYSDAAIPGDPGWLPSTLPSGVAAVLGDTRWEEGSRRLFDIARLAGAPAVLDADRAPRLPDLLSAASHVALSAQALREISAAEDLAEALARLRAVTPAWLGVTDGARGVFVLMPGASQASQVVHSPGFAVNVVDTLGAGDVWHGAFALALGEGQPEVSAVRFASAAAALKCTRFGGRAGTPTRTELEAFLEKTP